MRFGFILYGGPDQLMPLTSGLAAFFAFLLIFWNKVMITLGKIGRLFRGSSNENGPASGAQEQTEQSAPKR